MARGSIMTRQNKDGSTTHYIKYRDASGRQVMRAVAEGGRREAERALTAALAGADMGSRVPRHGRGITFAEYVDEWLEEHAARLEPGTVATYEVDLRLRLKPFFGTTRLAAITPNYVRQYVAWRQSGSSDSPKTINNSLIVLRVALGHAVEDGLIASNPASSAGRRDRIKLPVAHREMDYLRLAEIPAYLEACQSGYRPLAEVLVGTGMRIGEAIALRWGDVDWRSGSIMVARARKGATTGSTKGDRARRVEVGPRLLGLLRDRRAAQAEHRTDHDDDNPIFPGTRTTHLDRSVVSRRWHHDALRRAGLRQTIRLHDLRHSAAAGWLAAGLPMVYVQRQLGRRQIATTIDLYGHLEESFLRDAAARAETAVWSDLVEKW